MTKTRVIGKDGGMPWHVPDDLKFFKRLTTGHPILMGRKTWDSLGRPLPNRRNLILSRSLHEAVGAEVIHDIKELETLELSGDIYVIGGEEIFRLLLPHCDSVYMTQLNLTLEGDTFFPPFEAEFPNCEELASTEQARWRRFTRQPAST